MFQIDHFSVEDKNIHRIFETHHIGSKDTAKGYYFSVFPLLILTCNFVCSYDTYSHQEYHESLCSFNKDSIILAVISKLKKALNATRRIYN